MLNHMESLRRWTVAGGVIEADSRILLVENLRRNGSKDWSTPGGVVELGEDPIVGLTREVEEETGLVVTQWSEPLYRVSTVAPEMGWHLDVVVHRAVDWTGVVNIGQDPDGIVVGAEFCAHDTVANYLSEAARWVREPMLAWMADQWTNSPLFRYQLDGADRATASVSRLL
jgi:ADP-ribose pyrophosphatase YjhB (NUDIX family)